MNTGIAASTDTPRVDKAGLINGLYSYLGSRLDSVGRRASFTMALLGSFLGIATASIVRGETASLHDRLLYLAHHPSIVVGVVAMAVLMLGETARIKSSDDLWTRIAFSDEPLQPLHDKYVTSTVSELFGEVIHNTRIVGGFLKKKVRFYNCGLMLFVASVALFVLGF